MHLQLYEQLNGLCALHPANLCLARFNSLVSSQPPCTKNSTPHPATAQSTHQPYNSPTRLTTSHKTSRMHVPRSSIKHASHTQCKLQASPTARHHAGASAQGKIALKSMVKRQASQMRHYSSHWACVQHEQLLLWHSMLAKHANHYHSHAVQHAANALHIW